MSARRFLLIGFTFVFLIGAVPALACSQLLDHRDVTFYTSQIMVTTSNFPDDAAVSNAANFWNSGCGGGGYDRPTIGAGACSDAGCVQIYLNYVGGYSQTSTGGCGVYQDHQAGQTNGGTITIYEYDSEGRPCSENWLYSIEHELGHVLGLDHPPNGDPGGACFGNVMGGHFAGVPYAPLDTEDCNHVDNQWYTPTEERVDREQSDQDMCNASCPVHCEQLIAGSYYCPQGNESPIIIDLDDDGFALTNAAAGVLFDLNADRTTERVGWTSGNRRDAFLCRDRNGDGHIGDGREFFGNSTPLLNGHKAPNGFVALREFDLPTAGGNDDGRLDHRDQIWEELRLWVDADHDGISHPDELVSLGAGGVTSIDLQYSLWKYVDDNGNTFRFRGRAVVRDRKGKYRNAKIYDVFLSTSVGVR